jgi:hypothetical protein
MSPALIALIVSLVEEAIKDTPGIVTDLKAIFANPDPTPADWEALRSKVLAKSYADYVPARALPPAANAAPLPGVSTAAAESNAPISQASASAPGETAAPAVNQPETTSAAPAPAASAAQPAPYLADGSPNPAYVHPSSSWRSARSSR